MAAILTLFIAYEMQLVSALLQPMAPRSAVNEQMIEKAERYFSLGNKVKQQLGPTNPKDLEAELAQDFEFVAPLVGPLSKQALMDATAGLDLFEALPVRRAIPRLPRRRRRRDARVVRARDRNADGDPEVRGHRSAAVVAAGRGVPPEAVSLRFTDDEGTGQLRELTTGYPVDRRVGTTGGLGGLFGILEGLGAPLPPPLTRPTFYLLAPLLRSVGLAPPPPDGRLLSPPPPRRATGEGEGEETEEKTLLGLTEALLRADYGVADPTLLAEDFTFTGPVLGPLTKDEYLQAFGGASARGPSYFESLRAAMPDLDYRYRDARQCAFDERRVWFTSSPSGTHTGETLRFDKRGLGLGFGFGFGFDGKEGAEVVVPAKGKKWHAPPECCSAQFDEEGRCVALTGGYGGSPPRQHGRLRGRRGPLRCA